MLRSTFVAICVFFTRICYKDKQTVISLFDMSAFMVLWLLVVILMLLGFRWFDLHSLLKQIAAFVLFGCLCYIPFVQTFPRKWTQKATEICRRFLQQLQCKKFMFFHTYLFGLFSKLSWIIFRDDFRTVNTVSGLHKLLEFCTEVIAICSCEP